MFKYIKWELKDYFKKGYKLLALVALIYILLLIIPITKDNSNSFLPGLIVLAYSITLMVSIFGAYFLGTVKVINTFTKKTFLLESMIPFSAKRILLAKYILGIIINTMYILILLLGIIVFFVKGLGADLTFELLKDFVSSIDLVSFLKLVVSLVLTSVAFMSLVVLSYIIVKSLFPNSNNVVVGIIIAIFAIYVIGYVVGVITTDIDNIYVYWLIYAVTSCIAYFSTTLLIERKLEIYN